LIAKLIEESAAKVADGVDPLEDLHRRRGISRSPGASLCGARHPRSGEGSWPVALRIFTPTNSEHKIRGIRRNPFAARAERLGDGVKILSATANCLRRSLDWRAPHKLAPVSAKFRVA